MTAVFLACALGIFALSFTAAVLLRRKLDAAVRVLAAGGIVSAILLLLPLILMNNAGSEDGWIPPVTVPLMALQLGGLDGDYALLIGEAESISRAYQISVICMCYLLPLCIGGFVISLFDGLLSRISYRVLRHWRRTFCFSALSEKTLALAQSISQSDGAALIVFCSVEDGDSPLAAKAKEAGFTLFSDSETEFVSVGCRRTTFFEFSDDDDANLANALCMVRTVLERYKPEKQRLVHVFVKSSQKEAPEIISTADTGMVDVVLVDPPRRAVYDLLYENPLVGALGCDRKNLDVLILGSGAVARELFKAALWCGQMGKDFGLSVTMIAEDADSIRSCLELDCPELFTSDYKVSFYECKLSGSRLPQLLAEHCAGANYIVVAADDDELNVKTAEWLRSFYLRIDDSFQNRPLISVLLESRLKADSLSLVNKSDGYGFFIFGTNRSVYDYRSLVDSDLEKIALNVSSSYQTRSRTEAVLSRDELLRLYYANEIDRRSNRANALHYRNRLYMLGYTYKSLAEATEEECAFSEQAVKNVLALKGDASLAEKAAVTEHDRWNAYNRSEGYMGADLETVLAYRKKTGSHKFLLARYHGCICSWEELGKLDEALGMNFRSYDSFFIDDMLDILGVTDGSPLNVSGIRSVLVKANG